MPTSESDARTRSIRLAPLVLALVVDASCGSSAASPESVAWRVAEHEGIAQVERSYVVRLDTRERLLDQAAGVVAPQFVIPEIGERVDELGNSMRALARDPDLVDATVVALGSDGTTFASAGTHPLPALGRDLGDASCVLDALRRGASGRCTARATVGSSTIDLTVVAVRVEGGIVGAIAIRDDRAALLSRVRRDVRREGGTLRNVGVCVGLQAEIACEGVPTEVVSGLERRAASSASSPSSTRIAVPSARGVVVSRRLPRSLGTVAVYVPVRER